MANVVTNKSVVSKMAMLHEFTPAFVEPDKPLFLVSGKFDQKLLPKLRFGNVSVHRILGEGSFGVVFAGKLRTPSGEILPVAVKLFKRHSDYRRIVAAEVLNVNIVAPAGACSEDIVCVAGVLSISSMRPNVETLYALVMERLDGDLISLCFHQRNMLDNFGKIYLFSYLSMAMAYIVQRMHRMEVGINDFKPSNLGYKRTGSNDLHLKMIDLGMLCHFDPAKHDMAARAVNTVLAKTDPQCTYGKGTPFYALDQWRKHRGAAPSQMIVQNDNHCLAISIKEIFLIMNIVNPSPMYSAKVLGENDQAYYSTHANTFRNDQLPIPSYCPLRFRKLWEDMTNQVEFLLAGHQLNLQVFVDLTRAFSEATHIKRTTQGSAPRS